MNIFQRTIVGITALTITNAAPVFADDATALTKRAAELFRQDNLQEAVSLQEQAVATAPKDWLSHAALSFYYWQQGNVVAAADQGQAAVDASPNTKLSLMNLAAIREAMDDCAGAIPLYEQAKASDGTDWRPWLGIARCLSKTAQEQKQLELMSTMLATTSSAFDWYQELGDMYLRIDQPTLAVSATKKGTHLAKTKEQRAQNSNQLLLSLLRDNQLAEAKKIAPKVFIEYHPTNYELYVRTASTLIRPEKPQLAALLLKSAAANLTGEDDAEGFFRLGRIYEQKADAAKEPAQRTAWLTNARDAYQRAIAMNPPNPTECAKYHASLVGVLERQGDRTAMISELKAAQSLNQLAQLVPFLAQRVEKVSPDAKQFPISLNSINFKMKGLTCNCQISHAIESLAKVNGVAYVHSISTATPDEATLLFEPSTIDLPSLLAQAKSSFHEVYAKTKTPVDVEYEIVSSKPITSMQGAIQIAHACELGDPLKFFTSFKPVVPINPAVERNLADTRADSENSMATSRSKKSAQRMDEHLFRSLL